MKLFYSFQTVFWNGMLYTCIMYHKKSHKEPFRASDGVLQPSEEIMLIY